MNSRTRRGLGASIKGGWTEKKKKWVSQQTGRPEMAGKPCDPRRAVLITLVRFLLLAIAKTRS